MLKNIFEVLSRAWSEISQLQHNAEPHQMLGGALLPQLCGRRWDSQEASSPGPGQPRQSPAPSLGLALLTGTGHVPRGPLGSEWRGVCVLQTGLCFPSTADHALGFLHLSPDVLNQGGGRIWTVMVQPGDLAENSYLLLRK